MSYDITAVYHYYDYHITLLVVLLKAVAKASEERLFEQVYKDYTTEYLKGPMYWHEDKLQGYLPDYPGNPLFQNGAMTSNVTGNLKTFSSNELAYFSLLFLGIGLYGNAQFLFFDPQWAKVDAGENFNVSYIVERRGKQTDTNNNTDKVVDSNFDLVSLCRSSTKLSVSLS